MTGCGDTKTSDAPAAPAAPVEGGEAAATEGAATDAEPAAEGLSAEVTEALASLTPEQREVVLAQGICPVSEHGLGTMGAPLPVDIDGKVYYVCCEGCVETLKEDPAKYLANLPGAQANAADAEPADGATDEAAGG